jgi:Cu-Zn family superoxide dismutase
MRTLVLAGSLALGLASTAGAAELKATMHKITEDGVGASLGTVTVTEGKDGVVFQTDLKGLPPGEHGLHVHQNADCGPGKNPEGKTMAGFAAGGHWDPEGTKAHKGPEGSGHRGDLPVLKVKADGTADERLVAPHVKKLDEL